MCVSIKFLVFPLNWPGFIFEVWALNSVLHGASNLEKDSNFSSGLEKSLNLVKILEKYLISLFGLEISLKFTALFTPCTIFCAIRLFRRGKSSVFGVRTLSLCRNNILFLFLSNAISVPQNAAPSHTQ